jgi:hypothetical protein
METLDFRMVGHSYADHIFNPLTRAKQPMCKAIFETSIMQMRSQCSIVIGCKWDNTSQTPLLSYCFCDYFWKNILKIFLNILEKTFEKIS